MIEEHEPVGKAVTSVESTERGRGHRPKTSSQQKGFRRSPAPSPSPSRAQTEANRASQQKVENQ